MSNSSLVTYTHHSPNHYDGRTHKIDRITPHYVAGNCTVETLGDIFAPTSRRASSNYGIGSDGRIALYVDECNAPWTSGNFANDDRAVTIECANLADGSLTQACWDSLVQLCADICRRNGISYLNYTGDPSGNLTKHCWFQDTDCPGPWLTEQFVRLEREVNAILSNGTPIHVEPKNNTNGGKLDIDGYGGYNTVLDMQSALECYEDGVISGQWIGNRNAHWAMTAVEYGGQGSPMVKELQRRIGADCDGLWGSETSRKLQEYLIDAGFSCGECGADGIFGMDSVRALQRYLNDGREF